MCPQLTLTKYYVELIGPLVRFVTSGTFYMKQFVFECQIYSQLKNGIFPILLNYEIFAIILAKGQ